MRLSKLVRSATGVIGLMCLVIALFAAPRSHYSDREIVSRSELIIIGRMKEGSLVFLPDAGNTNTQNDSQSPEYRSPTWEHHLELVVSEVLKGQLSTTSVIVSVNYGLDPLVGGCFSNQFRTINLNSTNYPKDAVQIFDTGSSTWPLRAVTGDIRTNHIWLLRRDQTQTSGERTNLSANFFSISDPEDIQPVVRREKILSDLKNQK